MANVNGRQAFLSFDLGVEWTTIQKKKLVCHANIVDSDVQYGTILPPGGSNNSAVRASPILGVTVATLPSPGL